MNIELNEMKKRYNKSLDTNQKQEKWLDDPKNRKHPKFDEFMEKFISGCDDLCALINMIEVEENVVDSTKPFKVEGD